MIKPNTRAEDNVKKYLKAPTWEEMYSFIKEVGVSIYHFELYYGIATNHLAKVRCGQKNLARAYWHIFYERIIPTYGIRVTKLYTQKSIPKTDTKAIPKRIPKLITTNGENHNRLVTVK